MYFNPNGDLCKSGARLCEPQHAPLEIKLLRVTDPRSASGNAPFAEVSNAVVSLVPCQDATPLGLFIFISVSQGSSFLATLGWVTQSLRD
jgi:hypothetical protein